MSRVPRDTREHAAEPGRGRRPSSGVPVDRTGWVVAAPGFYVWDEDARYARAWGAELDRARPAPAPEGGARVP